MNDRRKFTAPATPPDFEERAPIREIFLYHFSEEDAQRWRYLGDFVYEAFMEGDCLLPQEHEESTSWRELSAVLRDLRYSQHWLARVVAGTLEHSCLDVADTRLCLAAADFSVELGKLCDRMDEVLG